MSRTTTKRTPRTKKATSTVEKVPVVDDAPKKPSTNKTKYFVIGIVLMLFIAALYLSRSFFIAAMVNGRPISRLDVVKSLEKAGGKQALDGFIVKELIKQEGRKQNVDVSVEELNAEIDNFAKVIEGRGMTLDAALSAEGVTREELEEDFKAKLIAQKILASDIEVSDEEAQKYFEDNKAAFEDGTKFEDLKDGLKAELREDKFATAFQNWYQKLLSESDVKYFVSY